MIELFLGGLEPLFCGEVAMHQFLAIHIKTKKVSEILAPIMFAISFLILVFCQLPLPLLFFLLPCARFLTACALLGGLRSEVTSAPFLSCRCLVRPVLRRENTHGVGARLPFARRTKI